jgi:hypothetical protein
LAGQHGSDLSQGGGGEEGATKNERKECDFHKCLVRICRGWVQPPYQLNGLINHGLTRKQRELAQDFAHLWKPEHGGAWAQEPRWVREVAAPDGWEDFLRCAVRFCSVCFRCQTERE